MKFISLWLPLLSACGAVGATLGLLSYFTDAPLFYGILAFALVLASSLLLSHFPKKWSLPFLGGCFVLLLALPILLHSLLSHSLVAASIPLIQNLREPYNVDMTLPVLPSPASPTPILLYLTCLLSWLFLAGFLSHAGKALAALLSLGILLVGFYFGINPPVIAVLLVGAYVISLPAAFKNSGPGFPEIPAFLTALVLGLVLSLGISESRYTQPGLFSTLQEKIIDFINPYDPIFHAGNAYTGLMKGTEGRQSLGSSAGIRYTGRIIASIESADVAEPLYLRSWVGGLYEKNQWKDLPDATYQSAASLFAKNQGEWYDQGAWLMEVIARNPALAESLLNYTKEKELTDFKKDFMVSQVYEKTHFLLLPYDADFGAPFFLYDRSPITGESKAYRTDRWQLPGGPLLSMMQQESTRDPYYLTYLSAEQQYRNFVYQNYLTIPDSVKEALQSLGPISKVNTLAEKRQRVQEIAQFLQSRYSYSTNPGKTPRDKDFISYFLTENQKGYCTSFASAAVILLRASGIPARYVVGLRVDKEEINEARLSPEGLHSLDINDHHAHAWAEVYVDGLGWRPCEMTPGVEGTDNPFPIPPEKQKNNSGSPSAPPDPKDQQTKPQEKTPQNQPPKQEPSPSTPPADKPSTPKLTPQTPMAPATSSSPLLPLIGKTLLLLILLAIYPTYRLTKISRLFSRSLHSEKDFHALISYSQKLAALAGHPLSGSYETWKKELAQDRRFQHYPQLIDMLVKSKYSGQPLTEEEKKSILSLIQETRKNCLAERKGLDALRFRWKESK